MMLAILHSADLTVKRFQNIPFHLTLFPFFIFCSHGVEDDRHTSMGGLRRMIGRFINGLTSHHNQIM